MPAVCHSFFVAGLPAPGGSKKGFVNPRTGRVVIVEDAKRNADWRALVSLAASEHFERPMDGPLALELHFVLSRPKGHFGTGKNAHSLRASAPLIPITKPDVTKLVRSTEDALKMIAWTDDNQVVWQVASKLYGARPGCQITVRSMDWQNILKANGG